MHCSSTFSFSQGQWDRPVSGQEDYRTCGRNPGGDLGKTKLDSDQPSNPPAISRVPLQRLKTRKVGSGTWLGDRSWPWKRRETFLIELLSNMVRSVHDRLCCEMKGTDRVVPTRHRETGHKAQDCGTAALTEAKLSRCAGLR